MRILLYLAFAIAALWLGDMMFNHSRYSNQIWFGLNQEAQKLNYEVRRWTKF
jgi:hypothetical protein